MTETFEAYRIRVLSYHADPYPDALAAEFASRNVEFSEPLKETHDGVRGFRAQGRGGLII